MKSRVIITVLHREYNKNFPSILKTLNTYQFPCSAGTVLKHPFKIELMGGRNLSICVSKLKGNAVFFFALKSLMVEVLEKEAFLKEKILII